MLAPVGMGAGLGACGEAADTHVPAVVRGAQPITAGPATLPRPPLPMPICPPATAWRRP